jgi:excisionase family DNA binding protein
MRNRIKHTGHALAVDLSPITAANSFFAGELFDVEEAARRLGGISPSTIRKWLVDGKIKRTKVGDRTMLRASELAKMVKE